MRLPLYSLLVFLGHMPPAKKTESCVLVAISSLESRPDVFGGRVRNLKFSSHSNERGTSYSSAIIVILLRLESLLDEPKK